MARWQDACIIQIIWIFIFHPFLCKGKKNDLIVLKETEKNMGR